MNIDDVMFKYMIKEFDTSKLIDFFVGVGPATKLEFEKSIINSDLIMVAAIEYAVSVPLTLKFINNLMVEENNVSIHKRSN